mgnify:CR=1 FL=1
MFRVSSQCVVIWLLSVVLSGCSLLEVKLDSQTTPLSKQELNARILTREYAKSFFTQVEISADQITLAYPASDAVHQSYVLLWKIHSEQGLQQSAYQTVPLAGLIDSWVFATQMEAFFVSGDGKDLFAVDFAKQAAVQLSLEAKQLARSVLSTSDYETSRLFVQEFSQNNEFKELTFKRVPAYRQWLEFLGKDQSEVVQTLGTMPEAMGDASERLSIMAEQTPKLMSWKAELVAMNSALSGEDLALTLASLRNTSSSLQDFIKNNPEYMQSLAQIMSEEMQPLLDDLSIKTDQKLNALSDERVALEKMVERERNALIAMVEKERLEIAGIVTKERALFTEDLDRLSQDVVTLAIDKLMELIKSTIIYFVLFILVVFFAPLSVGYWLGKKSGNK